METQILILSFIVLMIVFSFALRAMKKTKRNSANTQAQSKNEISDGLVRASVVKEMVRTGQTLEQAHKTAETFFDSSKNQKKKNEDTIKYK